MHMTDAQYKECTAKIKALADIRKLAIDDTDSIIRAYYAQINGEEKPLMEGLSKEEQQLIDAEAKNATNGGAETAVNGNGVNGSPNKKRRIDAAC